MDCVLGHRKAKILEIKNIVNEIKNLLCALNSIVNSDEKRIRNEK